MNIRSSHVRCDTPDTCDLNPGVDFHIYGHKSPPVSMNISPNLISASDRG